MGKIKKSNRINIRLTDEQREFISQNGEGHRAKLIRNLIDEAIKKGEK